MRSAIVLLLGFCCDAPVIFLFFIEQLRRSLPRAKRRVAHLCCNNSTQLLFLTDFTDWHGRFL